MNHRLDALRWPQVDQRVALLAIPLGATEQHGLHLPLGTDTAIATALCDRLADEVGDVLVAPAVPYGSSGEHAEFPGTLSLGQEALELLLVELVRSADHFAGVVLVNGHGGNRGPLIRAVRLLRSEGRHILAWSPSGPSNDSHAGGTETSAMLQLRPGDVDVKQAERGNTAPLPDLIEPLRTGGVRSVSANGVLGDPTHASAAEGRRILNDWAASLIDAVLTWETTLSRRSTPS
ncbi:mycofactocin biosynthesis peptidyl-dipeptidase MftE [Haloactinomyces albus]|uniref:Creatinine amidohydrolase n=1 Tax=Haloactinomyces albus TaxID=1352928 RepID=A0AAE4CP16_9ACTN|nr:mycofactocin biosynthesis peptidyl-dipeptidase MftE [Haloactinomyces albus]MDR7303986.1 creatinine amidohydrolase [Haloactinomyces albus]